MSREDVCQGPLSGLNVIDFGHYFAGPMAAMLLADQGANVIRVVRPGDTELPEQQYRLLNRNKKLLTLDLKKAEGKRQALALIERADVVIENFRPGVMKRLGLDYASVKSKNPGLIYLSLPGFASTDKKRAHIQAWEGVLGAAAGLYTNTSYVREFLDFPPLYTSVPVNSMYGGVHGAIAIMASLLARDEQGQGTTLEIPLAEAGMTAFGFKFCHSPMSFAGDLPHRVVDGRRGGDKWDEHKDLWYSPSDAVDVQVKKLSDGQNVYWSHPFSRFHRCADDRQVHLFFPFASAVYVERCLKAMGLYELLLGEGYVNTDPWKLTSSIDNNMASYYQMSDARKQRMTQLVSETFLTKTAEEWEGLLAELVPMAKVLTRAEYLQLPSMLESGVLAVMQAGDKPALTVPGRLVNVSAPVAEEASSVLHKGGSNDAHQEPRPISYNDARTLFKHPVNEPVPVRKGSSLKKGDLLLGLKVLDLSNGIAGPMTSYVLAQYGAEVVKLDMPLSCGGSGLLEVGQGKSSVLIDLKTAPGQEILQRLASWADVVVHNSLDKVAKRLGIDWNQLQAINPQVEGCQVSAVGGIDRGAWEQRLGFDPTAQAITGLMAHYGTLEEPHWHEGTMIADSMCGYGMAFGALLGIWQRNKTGYAVEVRTSLVRASNFIQLPWMIADEHHSNWGEAHGQFAVGEQLWQRLYQCRDGWIYIGTSEDRGSTLAEVVTGLSELDEQTLETAFMEYECNHWVDQLAARDIGCHRVLSITDICANGVRFVDNREADEQATGAGEILCWQTHPCGSPTIIQAPDWVRVGEDHSWKRLSPTPVYGANTKSILSNLGYQDEEIDNLIKNNIVRQH